MSMKKRRNELGHLSKEDYDSIVNRFDEGPEDGITAHREGFRASEEVLSKRRIIKVSS